MVLVALIGMRSAQCYIHLPPFDPNPPRKGLEQPSRSTPVSCCQWDRSGSNLLHATFSTAGLLPSPSGIGFHALINYCGGAFVYVRREYAGALMIIQIHCRISATAKVRIYTLGDMGRYLQWVDTLAAMMVVKGRKSERTSFSMSFQGHLPQWEICFLKIRHRSPGSLAWLESIADPQQLNVIEKLAACSNM